jgi:hypothetical protein
MVTEDDRRLLQLLQHRLHAKYLDHEQGIEVHDIQVDWTLLSLKEILDTCLFVAAAILRLEDTGALNPASLLRTPVPETTSQTTPSRPRPIPSRNPPKHT